MSWIIRNYWKYLKHDYYSSYILQKNVRQLPIDEIRKIQWKRLKKLLDFSYEFNHYYKDLFESENITPDSIKSPPDMEKIPITKKKDLIKHFDKVISKGVTDDDFYSATTSGSTGKPFHHYIDSKREAVNTHMSFKLNIESMGINPFDKNNELRIHFHPDNEVSDFKNPPKYSLSNRLINHFFPEIIGIKSYSITKDNYQDLIHLIKNKKIHGIYGFVSSIFNFAQFIDDPNEISLKYIITMGEGLLENQRAYISKIFNCPVFMDYGSSECLRMGFECKEQNGFHLDVFNYFFEFKKDNIKYNDGNSNQLIVTNLNNYVFPFIRYKTNDYVILDGNNCSCGINFPKVSKIFGKSSIYFITPSGNQLSSVDFAAFFEHYHKKIKAVRQFQVIRKTDNTLAVNIVPTNLMNNVIRKDIQKKILELVNNSMNVTVRIVDYIESEKSGKTKVLIV